MIVTQTNKQGFLSPFRSLPLLSSEAGLWSEFYPLQFAIFFCVQFSGNNFPHRDVISYHYSFFLIYLSPQTHRAMQAMSCNFNWTVGYMITQDKSYSKWDHSVQDLSVKNMQSLVLILRRSAVYMGQYFSFLPASGLKITALVFVCYVTYNIVCGILP